MSSSGADIPVMRSLFPVKMHVMTLGLLAAFAGILCFAAHVHASERIHPFSPGEKLTFEVSWGFIPAGIGVLEIFPMERINGVQSYHFVMTARTYPIIDLFYKVRDRIDAYTDASMTRSMLYKKQKEEKSNRDVVVTFDWGEQQAQYSNFGVSNTPIPIKPGSFDPLSVFYAFRLHHLRENMEIQAHVTDGKRCVTGKVIIIGRETVKVPGGTYDTFLAEPELRHIRGVFRKSNNTKLQIWVSADHRRIPVKIRGKVSVGSFVAELISAENLNPVTVVGTE
jgi:hypothetical protein